MDQVLVRDDRSRELFADLTNVERISDLAVLKMAEVRTPRTIEITHGPVVVARELFPPWILREHSVRLGSVRSCCMGDSVHRVAETMTLHSPSNTPREPQSHCSTIWRARRIASLSVHALHGSLSALLAGKAECAPGLRTKIMGSIS